MSAISSTLPCMPRKPESEKKKVPVASRIERSIFDRLQAMATADDRNLSYMIEKAIKFFLDAQDDSPHPPARPYKPAK
jgi:hypothetical protein